MNIQEAVSELLRGRTVRRAGWNDKARHLGKADRQAAAYTYTAARCTMEDLLAEDWELVDKPSDQRARFGG